MARSCDFCGRAITKGVGSVEHVVPEWLQRQLGLTRTWTSSSHVLVDEGPQEPRVLQHNRLVVGTVCCECNNGWMSRLETEAKNHVSGLVDGSLRPVDFGPAERSVVSRWVAKTALMMMSFAGLAKSIPEEHFRRLREGHLDRGILVLGASFPASLPDSLTLAGKQWALVRYRGIRTCAEIRDVAERSYKITLQVGRFIALVAFWPEPGWRFLYVEGVHQVLAASGRELSPWWVTRTPEEWAADQNPTLLFHLGLALQEDGWDSAPATLRILAPPLGNGPRR